MTGLGSVEYVLNSYSREWEKLEKFLYSNFEEDIVEGEKLIDTAIRIMKKQREHQKGANEA